MDERPSRPWHVFATYAAAVAGIFATTGIAIETLHTIYPDVPEATLLGSLPGLIAGTIAASTGLLLTLVLVVRPLTPARLRLLPGWETGPTLAVVVLGLLALGQALESVVVLAGLGDSPALVLIRRMLEGTTGPDLFGAVVVLGLIAGAAEEIFFRGYMQSRLREHWPPLASVVVTSAAFAVLHVDISLVHIVLAFALGLYLGWVVETTGSALPAITCHIVNNVLFTLQTALGFTAQGRDANLIAAPIAAAVFVGCVLWVRRAARYAPPLPPVDVQ
jgi:membrane protease YdiL (CAAX protease family)